METISCFLLGMLESFTDMTDHFRRKWHEGWIDDLDQKMEMTGFTESERFMMEGERNRHSRLLEEARARIGHREVRHRVSR